MTIIEDEIKQKEETKEDLKLYTKKTVNVPLGPAKIRKQYTYELLLSFRHSPVVKQRPECLSDEFCSEDGTWDPEMWHASFSGKKSRPATPPGLPEFKLTRKPSDAKERIKQEQDGIILSPQRRSFGHGCQITFPQPSSLAIDTPRPKSPLDKDVRDSQDVANGRVIQSRRRVITRPSRESLLEKERERRDRDRENGGYEDREPNERYQRRGNYDRQNRRRRDDQPEWFLDAPTSQLETIELCGFGEQEEAERNKVNSDLRRDRETNRQRLSEIDNLVASLHKGGQPTPVAPTKEFDINDFFNFSEPVPQMAAPTECEEQGLAQSRFSHFFSSNGPVSDGRSSLGSSRRSSLQKDELEFLQELRSGNSGSESAGSTPIHALINDTPESTFTLLEMLHKGSGQDSIDVENDMRKREVQQKLMEGQAKSLAEIEAELQKESKRRGSSGMGSVIARGGSPADVITESDQTAFNNFLAIIRPSNAPEKMDFRESPVPGSAPTKSSPRSSPGLPSPLGGGQTDHFFDAFKELDGRIATLQSPDVQLENDLHFRALPSEQNRLTPPLERGLLLDLLQVSTPQPALSNTEVGFLQRQSPLMQEQLSSILQPQMVTNNHLQMTQSSHEALVNLVKHAVVTNPGMVQSVISHGMGHTCDLSNQPQQRAISPQELYQHAFLQHQQATQRGLSPLVTSPLTLGGTQSPLTPSPLPGGITSPLGMVGQHLIPPPAMGVAVPPGAHQPSPIRPRIPSPQELVKHTQNILQHALIKRQLEVQRENFYARERETKNRSPVPGTPPQMGRRRSASGGRTPPPFTPGARPYSTAFSPTPSQTLSTAFTPTSVIRKMHESKAEAKANETKQSSPPERNQPGPDGPPNDATPSHIPQAQGSPSRQPVSDHIQTQGGYPSPVKGTDQGTPGQRVGPPAGHSTPQRSSQPNHVSPKKTDLDRNDAMEEAKDKHVQISQKEVINKNLPTLPTDSKALNANGDTVGSKHLTNHNVGFSGPHSPGGINQQLFKTDLLNRESSEHVPEQHMAPNQVRHTTPMGGGLRSYPGGNTPDQLRPMVRMTNQHHHHHPPLHQQHAPLPPMMSGRPPINTQFPLIHPSQRMAMGAPMGINPMAQQNLMRGMMFQPNIPTPRPPSVSPVNPMALLAMQQINQQRAALSQMQLPHQATPSPTQRGMARGMLPSQFSSPQVLHHPGAMGMSMVNPRNLSPAHPQMVQPSRVPLHHHGLSNDLTGPVDHQRNFLFQMAGVPPTSTNRPSAISPESGHSPLAKWFGMDILKQSHSTNPPVVPEGLKVLSVEELERQHQQAVS